MLRASCLTQNVHRPNECALCCKDRSSISNSLSPAMIPDCLSSNQGCFMLTRHVMLPWHTMCCTIEMWSTDSWLERGPAFALSCQIWDESRGRGVGGWVDGWGGSLRSPHSVASLSDCRRTHSIFHSRAVDSASALSLVTQKYLQSAEFEAVKGLSHFHTFWFHGVVYIIMGSFTDGTKYLPMTNHAKPPNPLCHHRFRKFKKQKHFEIKMDHIVYFRYITRQ